MKKKVVTYNKMSKSKKKAIDKLKRLGWGQVRPATITFKDKRLRDRQKAKQDLLKEWEARE